MPEEIELADGSKREVPTEEELQNLQAGHDANKEKKEKLAEYEKTLEETTSKLKKLENKDYNFKKLRDMSSEEKEKLSATEIELKKKQEELEESQASFQTTIVESSKNEALAVLVGDDKKIREKVLHNYDRIKGNAVTKDEINNRMRDAYNMLGVGAAKVSNPITAAAGFQGGAGVANSSAKTKIDPELASNFGITDEDLNNVK